MAKAKSGGTRSYLRGRIANDVYSIGIDGNGKKQQVVRSLAETVDNPRTSAQMAGRMIMSTVMQAVSGLSKLIDHSFDNVPNGQPSISEFIRRNYALVKADVEAHPSDGNSFGLVKYGEKGAKAGAYVIAAGQAIVSSHIMTTMTGSFVIGVTGLTSGFTAKDFRDATGLKIGDYITKVVILSTGEVQFFRAFISDALSDNTVISSENVAQLMTFDAPFGTNPTVTFEATAVNVSVSTGSASVLAEGIIISDKQDSGWVHNNAVLVVGADNEYPSDTALPTYPIGSAKFLNGGDL